MHGIGSTNYHLILYQKHLLVSGLLHVFITFLRSFPSFFMAAHMICPEGRGQPCSYSWLRNSSPALDSALPVYPSERGFSFLHDFLDSRDKAIFFAAIILSACVSCLLLKFVLPGSNLIRSCRQSN